MKSADTTPAAAIQAMRTLLDGEEVYATPSHQEVLRALLWQSARLAGGFFVDNNGAHARLLQGAKGIGKSTMLREFTYVCQTLYPSIVPIYITFNDVKRRDSVMRRMDIMEVIAEQLRLRGIPVAADGDIFSPLSVRVTEALAATARARGGQPLRVLLLVDEIDELYREPAGDENALSCLGNLAYLGDRGTGLFTVLLCGSSAVTPLLITCNASSALRAEFPLLYGAPNLNGQKYRVWRIPSPLPTDVDLVRELVSARLAQRPVDERVARLVAFLSGGTARKIGMYAGEAVSSSGIVVGTDELTTRFAEANAAAQRRMGSEGGQLYKAVLAAFQANNDVMMASLRTDGALDPRKVATVPWESTFKPLPWVEVKKCWMRQQEAAGKECDFNQLQEEVLGLCDVGYLVYDELTAEGVPAHVYPAAVAQLFLHSAAPSTGGALLAMWDIQAKAALKQFGYDLMV